MVEYIQDVYKRQVLSYFFGCINPAYLLAKKKGKNILTMGSRNPGASNTMLNFGWAAGILVGFCDILKACLAVLICKTLFPALPYVGYLAGICCIIGHMYNVFLRFRGGKGLASLMGMMQMCIRDSYEAEQAAVARKMEADALKYAMEQEAQGIRAKGLAEAEAIEKKAERCV